MLDTEMPKQDPFAHYINSLSDLEYANFFVAYKDVMAQGPTMYMTHGLAYGHPMTPITTQANMLLRLEKEPAYIHTNGLHEDYHVPVTQVSRLISKTLRSSDSVLGELTQLCQELQRTPKLPRSNPALADKLLRMLRITRIKPETLGVPEQIMSNCNIVCKFAETINMLVFTQARPTQRVTEVLQPNKVQTFRIATQMPDTTFEYNISPNQLREQFMQVCRGPIDISSYSAVINEFKDRRYLKLSFDSLCDNKTQNYAFFFIVFRVYFWCR
jgi:hypothetical protein